MEIEWYLQTSTNTREMMFSIICIYILGPWDTSPQHFVNMTMSGWMMASQQRSSSATSNTWYQLIPQLLVFIFIWGVYDPPMLCITRLSISSCVACLRMFHSCTHKVKEAVISYLMSSRCTHLVFLVICRILRDQTRSVRKTCIWALYRQPRHLIQDVLYRQRQSQGSVWSKIKLCRRYTVSILQNTHCLN